MRNTFGWTLLTSALAAFLTTGSAHAIAPISIEALSRQPAIQSVSMDPSGQHLVALIPSPLDPDETALATWDIAKLPGPPAFVTPSGKQGHMQFIAAFALKAGKVLAVARQQWTGDTGGCIEGNTVGSTATFVTKVYLTGDDLKDLQPAFASKRHSVEVGSNMQTCLDLAGTASIEATLPLDPDQVVIRRIGGASLVTSYYLYNLKSGKVKLLFQGNPRETPTLFDPRTGELLAEQNIPIGDQTEQILIRNPKTKSLVLQKPLTTPLAQRHTVRVIGIDDATGNYYVLTDQFSDMAQVWMYDAATQKFGAAPVLAADQYPIEGLVFGDQPVNFNHVVGYTVGGPYLQTIYISPELKAIEATAQQAFPGQQIDILNYTNDFSKVLFETQSASQPTSWHMLLNGKTIANVGSKRPWVKPEDIGAEKWVSYLSRDGQKIQAILDLPAGWKQGDAPLPAVVLPHGGPWARDWMGWDVTGWIPLLTSRGYAVLRPQYQGSTGFGRKFWLAGDKQWGLVMSNNIDDGATWLVSQSIAAKDKIAIFGYSYGGFAAVAADVRSPSPYQCSIAGAPVADLARLGTSWSDNRLQRIVQGQTVKGMNPMQNTDKAHLPILVFDGTRDVRTPRSIHAIPFYNAVKDRVSAKLVLIPDMPHELPWYPSQRKEVDRLVVNYLASSNCHMATPENLAATEP